MCRYIETDKVADPFYCICLPDRGPERTLIHYSLQADETRVCQTRFLIP